MLRGMTSWSLYLVRLRGGALYTGITTDVARRFEMHSNGRGAKCLRGRGPLTLVYRRRVGERGLALRVEHGLKRLTKREKEALVRAAPTRARLLRACGVEDRVPPRPRGARKRTVITSER
jgi:putative endonuclease